MAGSYRTILLLCITVLAVSQCAYGKDGSNPAGQTTQVMHVPPIVLKDGTQAENGSTQAGKTPVDQTGKSQPQPAELSTTTDDLTTLHDEATSLSATSLALSTHSQKTASETRSTTSTAKPPSTAIPPGTTMAATATTKPPSTANPPVLTKAVTATTKPPSTAKPPDITKAVTTTKPPSTKPPTTTKAVTQKTTSTKAAAPDVPTTKHNPKTITTKVHEVTSATENTSNKNAHSPVWVDKNSFTAKVLLPIAAGVILAVFIVLVVWSVRSCLNRKGNGSRKRLMDHDMAPTDRVMLLADSSEDEF